LASHFSAHLQSTLPHNCQIVIIVALLCITKECLSLLYFCFGEQSDLTQTDNVGEFSAHRNVIIVTGIWMAIMLYAILLCWRAYERSKCTDFGIQCTSRWSMSLTCNEKVGNNNGNADEVGSTFP
jgi:hypothetical protein